MKKEVKIDLGNNQCCFRLGHDRYKFRLLPGQELMETLKKIARVIDEEDGIKSGEVSGGIGGYFTGVKIFFSRSEKLHGSALVIKDYPGPYELTSLQGSITTLNDNGEIFVHCHCNFAKDEEEKHASFGGHLVAAKLEREGKLAGLTGEIFIHGSKVRIVRSIDSVSGLGLTLDSPDQFVEVGDKEEISRLRSLEEENNELRKKLGDQLRLNTSLNETLMKANKTNAEINTMIAQQAQPPKGLGG